MKNRFKEICTKLGYSQEMMAEKLSIDVRKLRSYMYETKNFPVEFLIALSDNLNVNINWLLTGSGDMFKTNQEQNLINQKILKIGERLSSIQEKFKFKDKDMALLLGIYEYEYKNLKMGKKEPTVLILNLLKQKFNISVDWLLYGE